MRKDVAQQYAFDPDELRQAMTAAGIRDTALRQAIMESALEAAKEIEALPGQVKDTWRYVDLSLTEIIREADRVRIRLHGRAWPNQPAEFLREELIWTDEGARP